MQLRGTYTALVTPFDPQTQEIDEAKLRELVDFQIRSGVDGVVPVGTTGESATLSKTEHRKVLEIVMDEVKGRIPVLAGVGSNCTRESLSLVEFAARIGVDAGLSISPYYNKPTQDGIIAHYAAQAKIGLPLVIYNVPSRTGRNIEVATTLELAKNPNIIGIKEASGDLNQIKEICEKKPEDFAVLSGEDSQTLEIIKLGGVGCVGVVLNQIPAEYTEMVKLALQGKWIEAQAIHDRYITLMNLNFVDNNPIDVKWALGLMGLIDYAVRLPLTQPSEENKEKIFTELQKLGLAG